MRNRWCGDRAVSAAIHYRTARFKLSAGWSGDVDGDGLMALSQDLSTVPGCAAA